MGFFSDLDIRIQENDQAAIELAAKINAEFKIKCETCWNFTNNQTGQCDACIKEDEKMRERKLLINARECHLCPRFTESKSGVCEHCEFEIEGAGYTIEEALDIEAAYCDFK